VLSYVPVRCAASFREPIPHAMIKLASTMSHGVSKDRYLNAASFASEHSGPR